MKKYKQDLTNIIHQARREKELLEAPVLDTSHLILAMLKKHKGIQHYFKNNYDITYDKYKEYITDENNKLDYSKCNLDEMGAHSPRLKDALFEYDDDNYDISTFDVLKNLMSNDLKECYGSACLIAISNNEKKLIENICKDIDNNIIGDYYENEGIKNVSIASFYYWYDVASSNKKGFIEYRKLPIIKTDTSTYDIMTTRLVTLNDLQSLAINFRASIYDDISTSKTDAIILYNKDENKLCIISFTKKDNQLKSKYASTLLTTDMDDIISSYSKKDCYTIIEDDLLHIHNESIKIYDTEQAYINREEEMEKKYREEYSNEANRQTSTVFKKLNCLSNVNERVKKNKTKIIGMDDEMEKLIKGLMGIRKPNVMLKGEAGVGKTALVEKLAILINDGKVPDILKNKIIYELSMSSAVAGTKYRGEFEEKFSAIIREVENNPDIILFVDEAHTIMGAGGAEGAIDASNMFKPALARGTIRLIGATTNDEFDKYIKPDGAMVRRFTQIEILEPVEDDVKKIMKGVSSDFEKAYNVKITDKLIDELYNKSKLRKGMFPDIALDELEQWCIKQNYCDYKENIKGKKVGVQ